MLIGHLWFSVESLVLGSNSAVGENRVGPSGRKSGNRYFVTVAHYYYYKCQDLSDAITTVAGALYKVYQLKCYTTLVSMTVYYQSAGKDARFLSDK